MSVSNGWCDIGDMREAACRHCAEVRSLRGEVDRLREALAERERQLEVALTAKEAP